MGAAARRFEEIVAQAMKLPKEQRERFVDAVCADDESLREAVRSGIAHGNALTRTQADSGAAEVDVTSADHAAARAAGEFPGYQIIRRLSHGGQGVVYQAIELSTKREVAIKVLRDEQFASVEARRRFEREIQTAAQLRHPDIIPIFHADQTPDGRPFFVMAYVRGAPLLEHVRRRAVSIEDALELFARICSAVDYAHHHGVLHRDLKPSNILVDADGNPSILDFGLAKWLGGPNDSEITLTQAAIGTLPYMAPEQTMGRLEEVDARTDIYSLGVILYKMLTGQFPYPVDGAAVEVFNNIVNTEPIPPERNWTVESGVRSHTGTANDSSRCPIDRDLRTIVMTALAKERQRRYQSAGELAADLRRYLAGDPVQARGESLGQWVRRRLRKAARRHRLAALLGAALLGAAIAYVVVIPAVYFWTPLHGRYENMVINRWDSVGLVNATNVRVIGLTDRCDVERLAADAGVEGVTVEDNRSLRRLHGALMERLAAARPRVVAWDVAFGNQEGTEYDEGFVQGVRALKREGVVVVVTAPGWGVDDEGWPPISRRIAEVVRWGAAPMSEDYEGAWALDMCVSTQGREPSPSLVTATLAAAAHPDAYPRYSLDLDRVVLETRYYRAAARDSAAKQWLNALDRIRLTAVLREPADDPEYGVRADDRTGTLSIPHAVAAEMQQVLTDYSSAMAMDPAQMRGRFGGRIVLVGDLRGRADRHAAMGGVEIPGLFVHAAALEITQRREAIREPWGTPIAVLTFAAALIGVIAATFAGASAAKRTVVLGAAALLAAGACVGVFYVGGILCNPIVPAAAVLLAGGLAVFVPSDAHTRI